ncbi:MAG: hypothetical protein ACRD7E_08860 [Bryobacteraceae bacterium]
MEIVRSILSASVQTLLRPFEGHHPLWSLIPISVLLGLAMLWVFRRLSNQEAIRQTKNRLQAHLYELRLFVDEPKLIWKAQVALLRENVRYMALMLLPAAVMTVPLLLLFAHLEAFYGLSPLEPGQPAIITVQLNEPLLPGNAAPSLELPEGIEAETPPVRVLAQRQISWRIRPSRPASGTARITIGEESATKSIAAGSGPRYLSSRRVRSILDSFLYPGEPRLETGVIESIEVSYPPAEIEGLGLSLHWLWWLLFLSMGTAFLLRRRFNVQF